jgi:CBS domain-containing protein
MKSFNQVIKRIKSIIYGKSSVYNSGHEFNELYEFAISFSFPEGIIAQYLRVVLKSIGIEPCLCERSQHLDQLTKIPTNIQVHFLIVPSKYDDLLSPESYALENEVRWIVRNNPECCIVFVQTPDKLGSKRIEDLVRSTRRISQSSVDIITFSNHDSLFNFTQKVVGRIMPLNGSDSVNSIAKPVEELIYVRKDSLFSDLFYKMDTMGVRHCPVFDPETGKCSRIVSRRDLVRLVPPGNLLLPQEVQDETGITISPLKLMNLVDELGEKTVGELFPDYELVSVSPTASISKAVELLSVRHPLGGNQAYISGLPVVEGEQLLGFISYTDVLKKFIFHQESYLQTKIDQIATMAKPDEPLWTLHESQLLRDAVVRLAQVRSLPVVDKLKSERLVGFVEDVQVMAYNHRSFAEQLGTLGVKHFMTPMRNLHTPMPGELLKDCIKKFWESSSGKYPPSTLAVCDTKNGDDKRLRGVISYVDILREWRKQPTDI